MQYGGEWWDNAAALEQPRGMSSSEEELSCPFARASLELPFAFSTALAEWLAPLLAAA